MGEERRLCEARIVAVAERLAAIRGKLVFIGGTVLPLLVDVDERFHAPRMTDDVDAVGIAASYTECDAVERAVAAAGYRRDVTARHKGRWIGPDESIFDLSFAGEFAGASGSRVDEMAIETAIEMYGHPDLRHLSPTGLFLMKCAAYQDRGRSRPEDSKDLADLAVLLVGGDLAADVQRWTARVHEEVRLRAQWLSGMSSTKMALLSHFAERYPKPPDTTAELADEAIATLARIAERSAGEERA